MLVSAASIVSDILISLEPYPKNRTAIPGQQGYCCLLLIKAMYRLESAVLGAASGYAALSNSGINVGDRELGLPCPVRE